MERIILDYVILDKNRDKWYQNASLETRAYVDKMTAPFEWLYKRGILLENGLRIFSSKENPVLYFAIPATTVEKYREDMLNDGIDEEVLDNLIKDIRPCHFCGCVSSTSNYIDYRDVDGCVGRYHSCDFCRGVATKALYEHFGEFTPIQWVDWFFNNMRKWEEKHLTTREQMRNIKKGETFFVDGEMRTASTDSHLSGDASYDGYIVYDENGESWFEEDFN